MITQAKSRRSPSGGRYKKLRDKRLSEIGSEPTFSRVGEGQIKRTRIRGGGVKLRVMAAGTANVYDARSGKYVKANIKAVVGNPASKHFIRRNIITKGSVIDTDLGKARVTNRPGQEGAINAVLLQ
ncbi:30S ribosomal protein S8e [Candidatus Woesearchaeota archaeon]|nr:30S ribosomal protein S8e [Candidatus Woesearchaeota archaeon]